MSKKQLLAAILDLQPDARAALLREVDDLVSHDASSSESPEFIADLEHRTNQWLNDSSLGIPWEQVSLEMKALVQKISRNRGRSKPTPSPRSNLRRRSSTTN